MSIKLRPKLQKAFLLQILSNVLYALFNRPFVSINVDLGLLRSFIRGRYARELWYIEYKTGKHLPLISPARAFLYRPLGSRFSHSSTLASTYTSTKGNGGSCFSCSSRANSRSALYGEMKDVMAIDVEDAKSSETSRQLVSICTYLRDATNIFLTIFGRKP